MSGACHRRWRSGRGRNPVDKRGCLALAGTAIWILPVPWAFSPAPSATLAQLWYPLCGQRSLNANTDTLAKAARLCPSKTAEVHYRPSTVGMPKPCDVGHMTACAGQGDLGVTPRPHDGSHGKVKAPVECESQAGTARSATVSRTAKPGSAGFPDVPFPGA
jgi:hypothetical protein